MSAFDLSVLFFLQMAFILGVCRIVGIVLKRLGQSQVVSEMIAGVVMGPSLMGWMFPRLSTYLCPADASPSPFDSASTLDHWQKFAAMMKMWSSPNES